MKDSDVREESSDEPQPKLERKIETESLLENTQKKSKEDSSSTVTSSSPKERSFIRSFLGNSSNSNTTEKRSNSALDLKSAMKSLLIPSKDSDKEKVPILTRWQYELALLTYLNNLG